MTQSNDEFIQKHLAIIKDKSADAAIKLEIGGMFGGLGMASVQHFIETGTVNGELHQRIKKLMFDFAKGWGKTATTPAPTPATWQGEDSFTCAGCGHLLPISYLTDDPGYCCLCAPTPEVVPPDLGTKYEIDFCGHILALIGINGGKPYVEACINGYGDSVPTDKITIKEIKVSKEIE